MPPPHTHFTMPRCVLVSPRHPHEAVWHSGLSLCQLSEVSLGGHLTPPYLTPPRSGPVSAPPQQPLCKGRCGCLPRHWNMGRRPRAAPSNSQPRLAGLLLPAHSRTAHTQLLGVTHFGVAPCGSSMAHATLHPPGVPGGLHHLALAPSLPPCLSILQHSPGQALDSICCRSDSVLGHALAGSELCLDTSQEPLLYIPQSPDWFPHHPVPSAHEGQGRAAALGFPVPPGGWCWLVLAVEGTAWGSWLSTSPLGQDAARGGHAPHPMLVALGVMALATGFSCGVLGCWSPFPRFPPCPWRIAGLGDTSVTVSHQPWLRVLPQHVQLLITSSLARSSGPRHMPCPSCLPAAVGGCGGPDHALS